MISDDFIVVTIFSMEFFNHSVFGYFSKEIFPKKKDAASATIASALFPWIIFQSKSHHFLHVHASLHQIHNDTESHFNVEQTLHTTSYQIQCLFTRFTGKNTTTWQPCDVMRKKRAKSPPCHQNVKLQQIWFLQWQDPHCLNFAGNKQSLWIFESKLFNFFLLWITSNCRFLEIFREHTTWMFWFELFLFPFFNMKRNREWNIGDCRISSQWE